MDRPYDWDRSDHVCACGRSEYLAGKRGCRKCREAALPARPETPTSDKRPDAAAAKPEPTPARKETTVPTPKTPKKKRQPRPWTPAEDSLFAAHDDTAVATLTGRSVKAAYLRRRHLRLLAEQEAAVDAIAGSPEIVGLDTARLCTRIADLGFGVTVTVTAPYAFDLERAAVEIRSAGNRDPLTISWDRSTDTALTLTHADSEEAAA